MFSISRRSKSWWAGWALAIVLVSATAGCGTGQPRHQAAEPHPRPSSPAVASAPASTPAPTVSASQSPVKASVSAETASAATPEEGGECGIIFTRVSRAGSTTIGDPAQYRWDVTVKGGRVVSFTQGVN